MSASDTRRLATLFGVLSAILFVLSGVASFFFGFVVLAYGSGGHALLAWIHAVVDVVVGLLVGLFTMVGRRGGDGSLAAGIILIVIAVVGWFALGFGGGILDVLAALFALISGILYLVATR